jgi:AraC family L-rhamnose operon transcriptional activator RhaR
MDWLARLNRCAERNGGRVPLGEAGCAAEVLHWAYSPRLRDNVPHRHTYFEVCLVGGHGAGEYRVAGVPHPLGPGTLFVARPGVVHQIVNTLTPDVPEMELSWVSFRVSGPAEGGGEVAALLRRFADAAAVLAVPDTGGRIARLWRTLRVLAEAPPLPGGDVQLRQMMAALLLALAQAGSGTPEIEGAEEDIPDGAARRAVRVIHERLAEGTPPTVADVAQAVGMSPRHLTRVVRAFAGVAPAEYIEQARLHRAATLLLKTDDPIKQVAQSAGYADVHHFTRAFGRVYGCPPGVFRKRGGPLPAAHPGNAGALV